MKIHLGELQNIRHLRVRIVGRTEQSDEETADLAVAWFAKSGICSACNRGFSGTKQEDRDEGRTKGTERGRDREAGR